MDLKSLRRRGISLVQFLQNTELFQAVPVETIKDLLRQAEPLELKPGRIVLKEGESGSDLYVVVSGRLRAEQAGTVIGEVNAGEYFGEAALLTDDRRQATVRAVTNSELIRISRDLFEDLMHRYPQQLRAVADVIGRRLRSSKKRLFRPVEKDLLQFLKRLDLFSSLPANVLRRLEPMMQWMSIPDHEEVLRQGDAGDGLYVVLNGRLRWIHRDADGRILRSGFFHPGDVFGELSVLTGETRTATVLAVRDCELIRLSGKSFERIIRKEPTLLFPITRILAQRINGHTTHGSHPRNFCLLPIHQDVDPLEFGSLLREALGGKTLLVSAHDVPAGAEREGSLDDVEFSRRLAVLEQEYDYTIFAAEYTDTAWTRRCLRHADSIILLASASGGPSLSPVEIKRLHRADVSDDPLADHQELVILHDGAGARTPASNFLSMRSVRHHHVRRHHVPDFARLGRHLTGRSVGVVLGGGGARGLAHAGVYRALLEAGIPLDSIGGTSMGSIIGGLMAMQLPPDEVVRMIGLLIVERNPLRDYTFPFVSMIRGRQYSNALREAFGEQFIEELPVPFFAMAADLTDRKALAIDRGRLWKATRASSSLPGIAPPLLHSGHLLVDGGIMNNVPADVMKERGAGRVLAVHVGENDVTVNDAVLAALQRSPGEAPPVLRMLWNRMLPRSRRTYFPGLAQILLRSAMLGGESHDQVARASATVWTTLPVHEFSLLNWKAAPDLIEIGYRHAMDNMDEWKRLLLE